MKRILLILIVAIFAATVAQAKEVTLSWDASPSPSVTGYKIYYSEAPDIITGNVKTITAGDTLTQKIAGLDDTTEQYFAVTAIAENGSESAFSNIVSSPVCTQPEAPNASISSRCTSIHINIGQ